MGRSARGGFAANVGSGVGTDVGFCGGTRVGWGGGAIVGAGVGASVGTGVATPLRTVTCADDTLEASADLARRLDVGVHIHVAEDRLDTAAPSRLQWLARDEWLLVHCVHLDRPLPGTIAHNSRSNMNNAVGYAHPATRPNPIVLGTDGIGADMLEELRLTYVRLREDDVTATPDPVWSWLEQGYQLVP